jgi:negative regulator of sigma E activity
MSKDALSALLDGECSDADLDRLLGELERSPDIGSRWSRMCLARDAREGTVVTASQPCIVSAVMAQVRLEAEAPRRRVVELAGVRKRLREASRRINWKPAIGFAAAASMGAAAVMFVRPGSDAVAPPYGGGPQQASPTGGAFLAVSNDVSAPVFGSLRSASLSANDHEGGLTAVQYSGVAAETSRQLREYLIDHSNSTVGQGVGGTLQYARFAAHSDFLETASQAEDGSR